MKRLIRASNEPTKEDFWEHRKGVEFSTRKSGEPIIASTAGAVLKLQYLSGSEMMTNSVGVRSVTIARPTLNEALKGMLEGVYLSDLDIDYDEIDNMDNEDILDRVEYINGEGVDSDYILYLANASTHETYIDHNYPAEQW